MMELLRPLGLLGLLGIAILILIYILKPNYQQKIISSTYVWKLSLKYRRKKLPINRFRNILLLICQILLISAYAMMLARPIIEAETLPSGEKIAIIDASAGMLTEGVEDTRFERAVSRVKSLAEDTFGKGERLTVILAAGTASVLVQRSGPEQAETVYGRLDALVEPGNLSCSYGKADIEGAIDLAEETLSENPEAEILLYTGTKYTENGGITVVDVSQQGEWNAAILDVQATIRENYYTFTVDVACYGRDRQLSVYFDFEGVNYEKTKAQWNTVVQCSGDAVQEIVLDTSQYETLGIYSFDSLRVYVQEDDSFGYDNNFYYYGARQTIRIQYASSRPNAFFSRGLMGLRDNSILKGEWEIELVEVDRSKEPATEGFDFYIFEHSMPDIMPTDGVVLLVDPDEEPANLGAVLGDFVEGEFQLSAGEPSEITSSLDPSAITSTRYRRVTMHDGFQPLLYIGDDPVLLLKNTAAEKIVLMTLDLNYSNLPLLIGFPGMLYNMYTSFFPFALTDATENPSPISLFEVDETVRIDSVSDGLSITAPDGSVTEYEEFPSDVSFDVPGAYTLKQTLISGRELIKNFYVKLPASESNIFRTEEKLSAPVTVRETKTEDKDLLLYFAAPMVALLFIEWWLQAKENF